MRDLLTQVRIESILFLRDRTVVAFHVLLPVFLFALLFSVHGRLLHNDIVVRGIEAAADPRAARAFALLSRVPGVRVAATDPPSIHDESDSVTLTFHPDAAPGDRVELEPAQTEWLGLRLQALGALSAVDDERQPSWPVPGEPVASLRLARLLLSGTVAMLIASVSLFGFGARLASYRQRGFLVRIALSPLGVPRFLLAVCVHRVCFIMVMALLLLLAGSIITPIELSSVRVGGFALMVLLGAFCLGNLGLLIGGLASSGEAAAGWCQCFHFPMLLLCGAYFPIESLPKPLQEFGPWLPMTHLVDGLRWTLAGSMAPASEILALFLIGSAFLAMAMATFRPEE